jgi:hypothetical protein
MLVYNHLVVATVHWQVDKIGVAFRFTDSIKYSVCWEWKACREFVNIAVKGERWEIK